MNTWLVSALIMSLALPLSVSVSAATGSVVPATKKITTQVAIKKPEAKKSVAPTKKVVPVDVKKTLEIKKTTTKKPAATKKTVPVDTKKTPLKPAAKPTVTKTSEVKKVITVTPNTVTSKTTISGNCDK